MSFKLNDNILLTMISHRYNLKNTTTSEASDQAAFKFHFKIRHPMPTTNFEKVFFLIILLVHQMYQQYMSDITGIFLKQIVWLHAVQVTININRKTLPIINVY